MTLVLKDRLDASDVAAAVLRRISVRAPYFDLRDLSVEHDGTVRALVPLSAPTGLETGSMEAAQAARHMAILGSCAVAMQRDDDDRQHYLATRAHFLRTANVAEELVSQRPERIAAIQTVAPPVDGSAELVEAEASGIWIDRRSARALVKLYGTDGQLSHVLDVHFTVMAPRMFSRLMPAIDSELLRDDAAGAAAEAQMGLATSNFAVSDADDEEGVVVDCGLIPVDMCAGHFPDYPAAPVALVMGRLARASGVAMNRHLGFGDLTYSIDEARVVATKLGRAGQRLILRARHERRVGGSHLMVGTAEADGEVIGEMELTLSVTCLPEPIPFPVGALA